MVELDYYQHRNNPYSEEEEKELTDNLIGVICGDEQGIWQLNDLSYKDSQQVGAPLVNTYLEEEKFIELCKELGIGFHKYPICAYCDKPIFGAFTFGDKGNKCFDCEEIKDLK